MNYSKIIEYDTANGYNYSVTIWVCGCDRRCKNCFNSELWDANAGKPFTQAAKDKLFTSLSKPHIKNFVILGGEPLSKYNADEIVELCREIKENFDIQIIVYTGYSFKELENIDLQYFDIIIDGSFEEEKRVYNDYRGSSNQRCWRRGELGWYDSSDCYFKTDGTVISHD